MIMKAVLCGKANQKSYHWKKTIITQTRQILEFHLQERKQKRKLIVHITICRFYDKFILVGHEGDKLNYSAVVAYSGVNTQQSRNWRGIQNQGLLCSLIIIMNIFIPPFILLTKIKVFSFGKLYLLHMCVHVQAYMFMHTYKGEKTTYRSQFSSPTMWIVKLKHRPSGFVARTFAC